MSFQTPRPPTDVNCPRDVSRKKSGIPANTSVRKYGIRKAPAKVWTRDTKLEKPLRWEVLHLWCDSEDSWQRVSHLVLCRDSSSVVTYRKIVRWTFRIEFWRRLLHSKQGKVFFLKNNLNPRKTSLEGGCLSKTGEPVKSPATEAFVRTCAGVGLLVWHGLECNYSLPYKSNRACLGCRHHFPAAAPDGCETFYSQGGCSDHGATAEGERLSNVKRWRRRRRTTGQDIGPRRQNLTESAGRGDDLARGPVNQQPREPFRFTFSVS